MDAEDHHIGRVIQLLEALERCLRDEQQALVDHDIDALREAATFKETLLRQLDAERDGRGRRYGVEDRPGMSRVVELLQRCQELTRDNARLIDRGMSRVAQALRILTGVGAAAYYSPHTRSRKAGKQAGRMLAIV